MQKLKLSTHLAAITLVRSRNYFVEAILLAMD